MVVFPEVVVVVVIVVGVVVGVSVVVVVVVVIVVIVVVTAHECWKLLLPALPDICCSVCCFSVTSVLLQRYFSITSMLLHHQH